MMKVLLNLAPEDAAKLLKAFEQGELVHLGVVEAVPLCHICDKPATCYGTYEGITGYSCDDCCGHGCEDGHCEPIDKSHR